MVVSGIMVMLILASLASAGEPTIQKGSAGLWYGFNGLSTMSYDDSWFGAQYFIKDKTGAGVGFYFSKSVEDDNDDEPEKTSVIGMEAYLIHYPFQRGSVALFVAPNVGFGYSGLKDEDDSYDYKATSLWLGGSLGVEWWLFDNVSLSFSNWLGIQKDFNKDDINDIKTSNTYFGILGSSSCSALLSFYFK